MGKSVLVAGLALTYDRQPFPPVPHLMALADKAIKLAAICVICGTEAIYHKRISNLNNIKNANPLSPDPRFVDHNSYEARCRRCFAK